MKCGRCGHDRHLKDGYCPACYRSPDERARRREEERQRDDRFAVNTCCLRYPNCRCEDGP